MNSRGKRKKLSERKKPVLCGKKKSPRADSEKNSFLKQTHLLIGEEGRSNGFETLLIGWEGGSHAYF